MMEVYDGEGGALPSPPGLGNGPRYFMVVDSDEEESDDDDGDSDGPQNLVNSSDEEEQGDVEDEDESDDESDDDLVEEWILVRGKTVEVRIDLDQHKFCWSPGILAR